MSPYEKLFHVPPDYSILRVFGCGCFPYLRPYNKHKYQFRSENCVFLGYSSQHKGYKCLSPTGRVYITRNVVFHENDFPYESLFSTGKKSSPSSSPDLSTQFPLLVPNHCLAPQSRTVSEFTHGTSSSDDSQLHESTNESLSSVAHTFNNQEIQQGVQIPSNTHPMVTRAKDGISLKKVFVASTSDNENDIPHSVAAALKIPHWKEAMDKEYQALMQTRTWSLVPPSDNQNIVGNKWIFSVKKNFDGSINRYKARLVAKGFKQVPGIDFDETYSPVVKSSTIRIILSLAVQFNWPLRQVDINNAFLNGNLVEEVYTNQPMGFVDSSQPMAVCKLHKALYGLRQAPRAWFDQLKSTLLSWGFSNSKADNSLFIFHHDKVVLYVLVYVDDIIVTGSNVSYIQSFIDRLNSRFALKDIGDLSLFLGMEAHRIAKDVLNSTAYINHLLQKGVCLMPNLLRLPFRRAS
ncbi:hypothetical protein Syun_014380 [Stephania yunnanensis]|uniref:Reverse transcriptase Ty1/copia-type domain-containing protein n=1 Tax=Stephania yunnanensis TaxID=152371 RepID=A0AAP0JK15_9MAGN